jgi:hypothetical protein
MHLLSRVAAAVLGIVLGGSAGAAPRPEPPRRAISLTVSGGVSLGAYEAGALYYSLAALHDSREVEFRLLTGASAGSINALLAVLTACHPIAPSPPGSLFWRTWVPVGFDRLYVPEATTPLGVFSKEWLAQVAVPLEEAWNRGIDESCDFVLGVSTTRMEPRTLRAARGMLELPQMEEKFVVRIQGRGLGRPPRATNYAIGTEAYPEPLLVTGEDGEIPFAELRDLLFASMSFPVAFPPQTLRTCAAAVPSAPGACPASRAEPGRYIDGGVFDNSPLRLAVTVARRGLRQERDGSLTWRERPDPSAHEVPAGVRFAFIDPSLAEYPSPPRRKPSVEHASLMDELQIILGALVDTARSKELRVLLEESPDIADQIILTRRHFPAASAPLFAFLGFFETEFRAFDFYLGMYDARRDLARVGTAVGVPEARRGILAWEPASWAPFACMRAIYDGEGDAEAACGAPALRNFRALVQLSIDQLYDACSEPSAPRPTAGWSNAHCNLAAQGRPPPRVPGVPLAKPDAWKRHRGEAELAYSMRLLGEYGFEFADLDVPTGRGDLAVSRIRAGLGSAGRRLAAMQPFLERGSVGFAAKAVADAVAYSPPDFVAHLTMGPTESELGLSMKLRESRFFPAGLRVMSAVYLRGLENAFTSGVEAPFAVGVVGGVELQPPPGSSILAQLRLGLRGGWLFGEKTAVEACDTRVGSCSRPVIQGVVGLTALERFRLQVTGEWYPGNGVRRGIWSFAPGIGIEQGF